MTIQFLDLARQYENIKPEIDAAIRGVIAEAAFVSGPYVKRFEEAFAAYNRVEHCVACGNGTDALEIALEALNLEPNSEVVVPANSFIATAEAVVRVGLKVVFCDCDAYDYTISIDSLRGKISRHTRAIIVVHLYGHACDMDAVLEIAATYHLRVIEDCAQAHGCEFKGVPVGTIGDIGAFSFYPGKNLGAYGDAGANLTRDANIAKRMRMIGNHGRVAKYNHEFAGRNSRMDGLQAAILSAKLPHLDSWVSCRRQLARRYDEGLAGLVDLVRPIVRPWSIHAYHLYVVRTARRDEFREFLGSHGIETGVHYPISLPKLAAFSSVSQCGDNLLANSIDSQLLSLPIGDHMTIADVDEVVSVCRAFFEQ